MAAPPAPQVIPLRGNGHGHLNLATSIRSLRLRNGLSQRQLATRMSVPRTYVSKIENDKATPTLSSLERLARALDLLAQYDDLTTLSLDVGFSSHSHFSAAFREAYGRTPSEFRHSALHR